MKRIILFFALVTVLSACNSDKSLDELKMEISELETQVGEDPGNAADKITALVAKYEEFAAHKHADEKTKIDYLLRAGEMASLVNQHDKSIAYYEQIIKDYPESPKAATALFMKGYTLDDKMNKLDEAKSVYEAFLAKYPDNDFADDTQFLLKNLGKSEEEIIKQFEQNQQ